MIKPIGKATALMDAMSSRPAKKQPNKKDEVLRGLFEDPPGEMCSRGVDGHAMRTAGHPMGRKGERIACIESGPLQRAWRRKCEKDEKPSQERPPEKFKTSYDGSVVTRDEAMLIHTDDAKKIAGLIAEVRILNRAHKPLLLVK